MKSQIKEKREPIRTNSELRTLTRIVYIGNELLKGGGAPTSIDTLAPLLGEAGYEVKTASAKRNRTLRLLDMLWLVYRSRKHTDFVLIDVYSTKNFWYGYAVAVLCQKLQLKYLPLLHGGELPARLENSPRASKVLFSNAFLNIAPSLYMKTVFQQAGIARVRYIPNSIHIQNYPYRERTSLAPKIFWVRAFAEIYDPMLAVKVLELLLPKFPEAHLCMVGPVKDDSYKQCLRYVRQKRLPVKFSGRLSKEDWTALSLEYDIFLNTTTIDNTPVSVIEAMALGLPVISTNVGGLPYLISADIDGVLVPPGDSQRMAEAVKSLLKDPERAVERARAARKKVQSFDWATVKEQWQRILSTGSTST